MSSVANPALSRYRRRTITALIAYALTIVAVVIAFREFAPQGAFAVILALLPALPIIGAILAIGRYLVEESDEYLRLILTRRILFTTAFTVSVITALGFLEAFQQVTLFPLYWIAVMWFAGLGVATLFDRSSA